MTFVGRPDQHREAQVRRRLGDRQVGRWNELTDRLRVTNRPSPLFGDRGTEIDNGTRTESASMRARRAAARCGLYTDEQFRMHHRREHGRLVGKLA